MKAEVFSLPQENPIPPPEDRSISIADKLIYLLDQAETKCDNYRQRLEDQGILLAERTKKVKTLRAENRMMRRENFRLREQRQRKE